MAGIQANTLSEWMAGNVTGPGPFILEEYEPNQRAVLVANPDFPIPPASEKIIINFINSDATLLLQARNVEADVTLGMTKSSVTSLSDNENVRIIANDHAISEQIGLPNTKAPWDNLKVRQAVSFAVPYEEIVDSVAFGYGTLFGGPFMPNFAEHTPGLIDIPAFDMEKAKQLMADSGVATPIDVSINIPEGNTVHEQIATIIQAIWRELGINVSINKMVAADYHSSLQEHTAQTYIRQDGPGVPEAGYFLGYDMTCGLQFNLTEVCLEDAEALLQEARATTDNAKRLDLYNQIATILVGGRAQDPRIRRQAHHGSQQPCDGTTISTTKWTSVAGQRTDPTSFPAAPQTRCGRIQVGRGTATPKGSHPTVQGAGSVHRSSCRQPREFSDTGPSPQPRSCPGAPRRTESQTLIRNPLIRLSECLGACGLHDGTNSVVARNQGEQRSDKSAQQ